MKSNPVTTVLTWILGTSVILSVIFSIQFLFRSREWRSLQAQLGQFQVTQQRVNMLLSDVAAYGKRNPSVEPILDSFLESIGVRRASNAAATSATKPASR